MHSNFTLKKLNMEENIIEQPQNSLEEINIINMVENIFTNTRVKKKRKDIVAYYVQKLGVDLFGNTSNEDGVIVSEEEIEKRVDTILKEDKNSTAPYLKYNSPYYSKKLGGGPGPDPLPTTIPDSNYIGKGGECMVMGELLFRGYNVNNMMVDEGIDLVASKNNVFYYIQVKTKNIEEQNRFYFQIKQNRFEAFLGTQIRYILVARCMIRKEERTLFFVFNNNDIERLIHCNVIPKPANDSSNLSLKIEYDTRTGKPYMYDGRYREDVSFYMNNFKL